MFPVVRRKNLEMLSRKAEHGRGCVCGYCDTDLGVTWCRPMGSWRELQTPYRSFTTSNVRIEVLAGLTKPANIARFFDCV
jgi:hypothetical protein